MSIHLQHQLTCFTELGLNKLVLITFSHSDPGMAGTSNVRLTNALHTIFTQVIGPRQED